MRLFHCILSIYKKNILKIFESPVIDLNQGTIINYFTNLYPERFRKVVSELFYKLISSIMNTNQTLVKNIMPVIIVPENGGKNQNVLGDNQTIKLSANDTNGKFTVLENYNTPGTGIPMHVHENEDELFKILEGEMEFDTQGTISVLKAGDMILLPRNIPHAFRVVGNKNARAMVTVFPSGIEKMFEQLAQLPAGPPDFEKVQKICNTFGISFL